MNLPFKAVLLGCPEGHYEATLQDTYTPEYGFRNTCNTCKHRLALIKTVTIYPANPQPIRAAS